MKSSHKLSLGAGALAFLTLTACRQDMHDQPRYKPLAASEFFAQLGRIGGADPELRDELREMLTETTDDIDLE